MDALQGLLKAAGVAALAAAASGSLYYLYRSRAQKPTTTVTPVEGDPETVEETQAEAQAMAPLIMDEASEAPILLLVTDLAETEEAEVTDPEISESVVETLVEDGGVTSLQEEDQAPLIMDEATEAPILLLDTELAETEEAEVIVEPELCDSVMEKVAEDEGVEVDETKAQPLPSVVSPYWSLYIAEPKEQRQPRRRTRETVVGDGEVAPSCPQKEDQASEAPILLMDSDLAETKEAKVKADDEQPLTPVDQSSIEAEPKKKQRRRGTRGRGRKINYNKDNVKEGQ